jgi:hypothetical protein
MNKKIIDDLMKQSYIDVNADNRIFSPEKFAELIVLECIGVVESQKAKMSYGPTFVIEDIKQHFGVEE